MTSPVRFGMAEMEYRGGAMESDLALVPFEEKYRDQYKELLDACYYEMRKALDIRPYDRHSDALAELEGDIFLLLDGGEITGTITCLENEIGSLAVNLKYQRQGYGRRLMRFAIAHMQRCGRSPIILAVTKWNRHAIALYASLGFEITRETTVEGVNTESGFKITETGGLIVR